MVQNPTFASGLDSWVNVRGMSIEDGGLFGSNAARGIGYSMLRQYHSGLEEGIYTLSAHVKVVNNPVGAGEFTARIYDAENNILAISEKIFDTAGEWVRITATMDSPGVPAYIAILAGSISSLYTGQEEVLWDGVQFERGATATQFDKKQLYTNYGYNERGLLNSLQHSLESYTYEFDELGNITKITAGNGNEACYTYDSLNQLKSESITENGITRTVSYTYDSHGNMITRTEGNKETVYTYDLDRLVQIEEKIDGVTTSTQTLTYDNAGNLITDGEYSYTWQMGRQLQGITGNDLNTSYKYNENGLRTEKTVNGQTHEYTLLGNSVTREVIRDAAGEIIWTIHYSYAGDSTPVSINVNGTEYYYLKNAQGDITHIVDGDGNEVVSYEYDAWGNHLSITGDATIAELNPYRYRGYRYDSETGLYNLQSRYYNPVSCHMLSADTTVILDADGYFSDKNLYAYCDNNPVIRADKGGEFWHIIAGAAAGALIGGTVKAISNLAEGKKWSDGIGMAMDTGAASGALVATGVGLIGQVAGGAAIAMTGNATSQVIKNNGFDNFNVGDMLLDGAIGGIAGLAGGSGVGSRHLTNLGKQTVKRTTNALTHKGLSAAAKEATRATSYYLKNAKHVAVPLTKALFNSGATSLTGALSESLYNRFLR